jgi:divalent metal cation (Fe/Co/Zn/Cd) transporter
MMLAGLLAWAVQFTVIYGATSTLCGREWADTTVLGVGLVQAVVLVTTCAALIATALALAWSFRTFRRPNEQAPPADLFMSQVGALTGGLSLIAILWQGLPAFILPACA